MANNNVCDFCLAEFKGVFNKPEKLSDGHRICRECKNIIRSYGLPVKHDLFQLLVTAQPSMKDMIMFSYLENHNPEETINKFYPAPDIRLHEGEHCINAAEAIITVQKDRLPNREPARHIADVRKRTIDNIPDTSSRSGAVKVRGTLYETEAAIYFMSDHFVNCHRLGFVRRNTGDEDRVMIVTPNNTYTYLIEHADLFFMRERFFQKCNAAKQNKTQHLIYIRNDNEITITPGIYDIPKSLRPGIYRVKAVNDAGLHIRDAMGRVTDYYENNEHINLSAGGVLECTGEYELEWMGEKPED